MTIAALAPLAVAAQGAGAVLTVSAESSASSLPGAATALMLLRDSFEALLKKRGFTLADWRAACAAQSPQCRQALDALAPALVSAQMLDPSGRATFTGVPPGTYYVFGMRPAANGLDIWDLGTAVQPGTNAVQLTARNLVVQNGTRIAAPPALAAGTPPAPQAAARPVDPSIANGSSPGCTSSTTWSASSKSKAHACAPPRERCASKRRPLTGSVRMRSRS